MATFDGRLRLHIKNNRSGEEVFRVTEERYRAAAARHTELAARVDARIDFDLDNFDTSMAGAHALLTWDLPTSDLASRAPNLRWIHIIGAGIDHLQPLDWLPPGVALINNRGVHAEKSGQYGLMALLMLNNAIPRLVAAQHRHEWLECYTTAVADKSLLVVGAGSMGRSVAGHARRLGMRTIGIRRRPRPTAGFDEIHGVDRLDELLPEADFVLITAPATTETQGLIDGRRLALVKPGAGLVNMARASIVDHDALEAALRTGRLGGAILDVFDPEPLPATSTLWDVPNLVVTPHMSSDDAEAYVPLTLDLLFENIDRTFSGRRLVNRVDPARGY